MWNEWILFLCLSYLQDLNICPKDGGVGQTENSAVHGNNSSLQEEWPPSYQIPQYWPNDRGDIL